ncbi:hypothetical protein [Parashewanella curva]|nr:hypothetical protein [Parashewanella curva]
MASSSIEELAGVTINPETVTTSTLSSKTEQQHFKFEHFLFY